MANEQGLTRQEKLGDITFGIPGDIHPLNQPYGFYTFLGVMPTATKGEIKVAYKRLVETFHHDRNKNDTEAEEKFKTLNNVVDILLDDGGELGEEHSQRRQYDFVSSLESYFDGFIQQGDNRTKKLSEIMLIRMQGRRKQAKAMHEFKTKNPEVYAQISKLTEEAERIISDVESNLTEEGKKKRLKEILDEMNDISAKSAGLTPEARQEISEARKKAAERFQAKEKKFAQSLRSDRERERYFSNVIDIWYNGRGDDDIPIEIAHLVKDFDVTFGTKPVLRYGLGAHEERGNVLELILGGICYFQGISQVHFKAQKAKVQITDPHLEGIVHVIKGRVSVDYEACSYGKVIRARAPNVEMREGFAKHGDLYVPERFAEREWWTKTPSIDIAVQDGSVYLCLASQEIGRKDELISGLYDLLMGKKGFLGESIIKNKSSIIKEFYNKNNKNKY